MDTLTCSHCGSFNTIIEEELKGYSVCSKCGIIADSQLIYTEAEWRSFDNDAKGTMRDRIGGVENKYTSSDGLSTAIDATAGVELSRAQARLRTTNQGRLQDGFSKISGMCSLLELGQSTVAKAQEIYSVAVLHIRGRSRDSIALVCVFFACRLAGAERPIKELCGQLHGKKKSCLQVMNLMNSTDELKDLIRATCKLSDGRGANFMGMVTRYCNQLKLPYSVAVVINDVGVAQAKLGLLTGRNPGTVTAACVMMVCKEMPEHKRKDEEIAKVAGLVAATVRKAYSILLPYKKTIYPNSFE